MVICFLHLLGRQGRGRQHSVFVQSDVNGSALGAFLTARQPRVVRGLLTKEGLQKSAW
jgi:hypothetical protein